MIDEQGDLLGWSGTAQGIDALLRPGPDDARLAQGQGAFDLSAGAGQAPRRLRPDDLRPELPAGPAAGRGRRAVRQRLLLRTIGISGTRRLGHARQQLQAGSRTGSCPHRPDRADPDRGPGRPRPARRDAGRLDGRVRPLAEDRRTPPSSAPTAATTGRSATPS